MFKRKWLLGAIVASTLSAIPVVAHAQIYVQFEPPAPRHEVVPSPRVGYVWAPGHWAWRNGDWRWIPGHYVREKRGYYWHPGHWVERDGRWAFVQPGWRRERFAYGYGRGYAYDRDRDGIPDRFERGMRDSDRDGVPNRVDRDKDGDGVPNRYDNAPNNPYRR
jgi:hypothetical protein